MGTEVHLKKAGHSRRECRELEKENTGNRKTMSKGPEGRSRTHDMKYHRNSIMLIQYLLFARPHGYFIYMYRTMFRTTLEGM